MSANDIVVNLTKWSGFINFKKAHENLLQAVSTPVTEPRDLSGIIKDFEMTYELSWKVLKKVLREGAFICSSFRSFSDIR